MIALQVKGNDDDADSAFGTISDVTGTSMATYSTYSGSVVTSGLGADISDESKVIKVHESTFSSRRVFIILIIMNSQVLTKLLF